jgi:L-fucose mutarotase
MLKGISPLVDAGLLSVLDRMGHGDEIVFADAHFPAYSLNQTVLKACGIKAPDLLDAVLPLLELDTYVDDPVVMVAPVPGDSVDPEVAGDLRTVLTKHAPHIPAIAFMERFAFYERASRAYAIVATGETRKYGNILLKKGVTVWP